MKLLALSTIGLIAAGGYMMTGREVADYERTVSLAPERTYTLVASELRDVARLRIGGVLRHRLDDGGGTMHFKLDETPNERIKLVQMLDSDPQVEYDVGIAPGEQPGLTRLTLAIKIHPTPGNPDPQVRPDKDKAVIGAMLDHAIQRVEAGKPLRLAYELRHPTITDGRP